MLPVELRRDKTTISASVTGYSLDLIYEIMEKNKTLHDLASLGYKTNDKGMLIRVGLLLALGNSDILLQDNMQKCLLAGSTPKSMENYLKKILLPKFDDDNERKINKFQNSSIQKKEELHQQ